MLLENLTTSINNISLLFTDKKLEDAYIVQSNRRSIWLARTGIFLVFTLFILYGYVDKLIYPSNYFNLWWVRVYEVITLLILFTYSFKEGFIDKFQGIGIFHALSVGFFLLWIYMLVPEIKYNYLYLTTYTLYIAGVFTLFGLKFIYAVVVVMSVNMLMGFICYVRFDYIDNVLFLFLFFSTTFIAILSSYFSEKVKRESFVKDLESQTLLSKLEEAQKKLKDQANHDFLTGLYNRRYLNTIALELIKVAKRNKTPISIVAIDIDFFKKINDTFGHGVGDEVLKHISSLLEEQTRDSDIVARVGGEEFVLLLSNTNQENTFILADKIRESIQDTPFVYDENININLTISAGVVEIDNDLDNAIDEADKALYEAKNNGRNMVVLAADSV